MSQRVLWLTDPAPSRTSIFLTPFKEWETPPSRVPCRSRSDLSIRWNVLMSGRYDATGQERQRHAWFLKRKILLNRGVD